MILSLIKLVYIGFNEQAVKKFSGWNEIRLNISKKYNVLHISSLKPKKRFKPSSN